MDPTRPKRILDDWTAVAKEARPPAEPPRPVVVRSGLPPATLAGAALVVLLGLAIAGSLLARPVPNDGVGASSSPAGSVASAPSPSLTASAGRCAPEDVDARITMWEGAAGSRIATVNLASVGSTPCDLETVAKPRLVDGGGNVLIDGSTPSAPTSIRLAPGDVLGTLVQASNYCGPAPEPPVSVAFATSDGASIVATPLSATDAMLPPCNGGPGSAGTIEMQPWRP